MKEISARARAYVSPFDWGPAITRYEIEFDAPVQLGDAKDLLVGELHQDAPQFSMHVPPELKLEVRQPKTVELSADGKTLTLSYDPLPFEGNPFVFYEMYNRWSQPFRLQLETRETDTLTSEGEPVKVRIDETVEFHTLVDDLFWGTFQASDGLELEYGLAENPEADTLLVWLHGLGEGGYRDNDHIDGRTIWLAAKVSALLAKDFQKQVPCSILTPQSPTFWMDETGEGTSLLESTENVIKEGISVYTEALHELIEAIRKQTGAKKVIIAGCSNGGYMSLLLARDFGREYDAYLPICEPMPDKLLSDSQIEELAALPMYFIYAKTDDVIGIEDTVIPTLERLEKVEGSQTQSAVLERVEDTTGRYLLNGKPLEYPGHWSWMYFFNDNCQSQDGLRPWKWLADQLTK